MMISENMNTSQTQTTTHHIHQHRRKTAHGIGGGGGGFPAHTLTIGGGSSINNTATASHSQVPNLQINAINNNALGISIDSKGNQSTSSNNPSANGVQMISRKFIHFIGNNTTSQQQTSRAATHSQKRQNNLNAAAVGIPGILRNNNVERKNMIDKEGTQASPSGGTAETFLNPPESNRSGRSNNGKSNGNGANISEMLLQTTRTNNNGRVSQRKSNGVVKMPGSNAVSAPHHQLGYRRHQIMDITEDSNNVSKNKLSGLYTQNNNNGNEETLNSQESDRGGEPPSSIQMTHDGPAYSMFYHSGQNQMTALAASGDVINRLNSKKNLKMKKHDQQMELSSPYSVAYSGPQFPPTMNLQMTTNGSAGPFQFTRKQNMMNAENSLSATRETAVNGVKVIKLKKPQPIKISVHRDSMQSINAPSNSIGKRRPLIIRKNNYISGQGGTNERGFQKDMTDTSPFNKTSNFNTLMSGGQNPHGNSNVRLNNTSSFVGLNSEVSLSQTAGQIKNQTTTASGISHILKTLNQTVPSEENLHQMQLPSNSSHKLSQLTLKDAKLIRTNMSKKRLDTARKSRLHQIQVVTTDQYHHNGAQDQFNSLSQQPESRQPNPLSLMTKKKRSLLPKGGVRNNETQGSEVVVQTISSNGNANSSTALNNMLIHRPSERGSRRETQRAQLTTAENEGNQRDGSHNLPIENTKMSSKSEERAINNDHSAVILQQTQSTSNNAKILSRGQIMRLQKQKQTQIQYNTTSNDQRNSQNDHKNERSPINSHQQQNSNRKLQTNKSSKSLRGSSKEDSNHNSLTRVESKKDLQQVFKSGSQQQQPANLEKHFVKEELVILENIHDSSGTPGDFQFITKQSLNQSNVQQQPMILHIQDDHQHQKVHLQNLQLNQPSVSEYQDQDGFQEESQIVEQNSRIPPIIIQNNQPKPVLNAFGSGKKPNKPFPAQQHQQKVKADIIPITEEDLTQDTLTLGGNQQRLLNSSIAQVKSPIGTTTSFKSQNSQQAGANHEQIERFPMRPGKALKLYLNQLTDYEKGEILDYQDIYFLGLQAQKVHGSPKEEFNYGYDDDKGDYKVITKDHIGYRYEVLEFIGKGSFGTALKCLDHKTKEQVALKIVKNKKKYAYQAGVELKILNFLQENDPDDIMNVIHMKDYVIFRKHLCISFELLSMNLFEFLKINDFNGFDHNLIRRFAIQLLYALKYLKEFQIIHCDLKPENILLKEANKSGIKIIDFGSSTFLDERVYTYIQSRFYRAPEIMLGIPYTCAIDMWSFGCIMAELYIGYPIFPGESENDQMSRIIEMVDKPNQSVYDISQRRAKFFTENSDTGDYEPIMLKNSRGKLRKQGGKPLSLLLGDEDLDFLDFVEKCLEWDPEVRLSPDEALRHIWILKGLPPQVLVHHQRMHNISTPELPVTVREARDKFFQESNIQNNSNKPISAQEHPQHSGQAQPKNEGSSQLGGGASNSGNKTTSGKTQNIQQQSLGQQPRPSLPQNSAGQQQLQIKPTNLSSKQQTNIKAETIKSLERAQLKNQLHQLNPNKLQIQTQGISLNTGKQGGIGNITLHSKILPAPPQGLTERSDNSGNVLLTSTTNTARTNLQHQLASIQASHLQLVRQPAGGIHQQPQLLPSMNTQQYSTLNSNISPNKITGVSNVPLMEGTNVTSSGKFAASFKRRSHQANTGTAARHQRNNLLGNTGGNINQLQPQRPHDAQTH